MADDESTGTGRGRRIDFDEVETLVTALARDLAKVQTGSKDVQALRDEVEALRTVLSSERAGVAGVSPRLERIHAIMNSAVDTVIEDAIKAADYVARIGRMLGL